MSVGALLAIIFGFEFGLHYFPWRLIFKRELPRIPSYTLGMLAILIPFSFWLYEHCYIEVVIMLWVSTVTAGLSVSLWYGVDWLLDRINVAREAEQRETAAREIVQEKRDAQS